MNLIQETYETVGSVRVNHTSLSILIEDLKSKTVKLSIINLEYNQTLSKSLVEIKNNPINTAYINS